MLAKLKRHVTIPGTNIIFAKGSTVDISPFDNVAGSYYITTHRTKDTPDVQYAYRGVAQLSDFTIVKD